MGEGWFPRPRRGGEGPGEGPRGISSSRLRFKLNAAPPHLNPLPSEGRGRRRTGVSHGGDPIAPPAFNHAQTGRILTPDNDRKGARRLRRFIVGKSMGQSVRPGHGGDSRDLPDEDPCGRPARQVVAVIPSRNRHVSRKVRQRRDGEVIAATRSNPSNWSCPSEPRPALIEPGFANLEAFA